MAGVVHIPWYGTFFRGDKLADAVVEIAAVSLRYGATQYQVHRSRDDRYRILQQVWFASRSDWERYWDGPEMVAFRTRCAGWYQVPVLYSWNDEVAVDRVTIGEPAVAPESAPAPAG